MTWRLGFDLVNILGGVNSDARVSSDIKCVKLCFKKRIHIAHVSQ